MLGFIFSERDNFAPLTDIIGGGLFGLRAGQWTDDTSMALCLVHSLLEQRGFDAAEEQMRAITNGACTVT